MNSLSDQRKWTWYLGTAAGVFLGAVLLLAAWTKIIDPVGFVEVITREGLDLVGSAELVAFVALGLEVAIGIALLLGLRRKWVLIPSALLVIFFLFLTGRTYWYFTQGLVEETAGCGCFGNLVQRTPKEAFVQDLWILGLPLLLAFVGLKPARRGVREVSPATPPHQSPKKRLAVVFLVTAACLLVAWKAPSLPFDDLATRLRPGIRVGALCLGGEDAANRVCIDTVISELEQGEHLVVMTSLEHEDFVVAVEGLNSYALAGEGPRLWVLTADPPEVVNAFAWMQAPVFEVREGPSDLLRPLYRTLPRSFAVTDGEVTETISGLPSLDEEIRNRI
jgi:uncharacterized membrane protein YphA (DoxX/SURF4 family)